MSKVTNMFASLTLVFVKAADKAENVREQFAHALKAAFRDGKPEDLPDFCKDYNAKARAAIRADYSAAVQSEYDSYSDKDRAVQVASHTPASPSFNNLAVVEMHKRLFVLKVRASEAKEILAAFLAGNELAAEFYAGNLPVSVALAAIRQDRKDAKGDNAKDTDKDGESDDKDATTLEGAETALRRALTGYFNNGGTMAGLTAITTEVASKLAKVAK